MNARRVTLTLLAALSLAAAGCGDDLKDSGIPDGSGDSPAAALAEETPASGASGESGEAPVEDAAVTYAKGAIVEDIANAEDLDKKPGIPKPSVDAPDELVVRDLVQGEGEAAQPGDALTVRYVGASFSDGREFDSSWKTDENMFPFTLGEGQVIQGWDEGIVGMKPGGRRELVIPAEKAYGEAGSPPNIKGGETLVFVVDLKKIG
ncbi:MAG: FKBP-type peptidyl-prolyl cis-trans isomerase [Solirubrobacterales bacterium]|nr:FKBP-type peptidyl-prolyl cis-trans isomerase [Solirubrobacterales bacterium]